MRESFLAAYRCIDDVYRKKSFSGVGLNKILSGLSLSDKPLTAKLVYGVIDKSIFLTYIIRQYAKTVKPSVLPILQIGAYCLYFLSIPDAVAVNESVELAKAAGKGGAGGFVNAVLKNIAKNKTDIRYPSDKIQRLSVLYSYPQWAVRRLIEDYGEETAGQIISFEPKSDFYHIRNNPYILTRAELEKQLDGNGVAYKKSDGGFFVKGALNGVDKKAFIIQSLSSIFVCMASGVKKGDRILDLCAAPGGKSVFCAQLGAEVTACDIHPHRVSLIEKYAASLNVKLSARLNDATVFNKEFENAFDIVLCDVPCSGFGVVSSKPDIKLFKTDAAISSLAQTQKKILETACRYVRRGGRLVYSTCTLFKAENGDVVNEFLSAHGNFAVEEIRLDYPKTKEGYLQFLPHRDGTDGFFIALLKREY